jgi:hypothetical protein
MPNLSKQSSKTYILWWQSKHRVSMKANKRKWYYLQRRIINMVYSKPSEDIIPNQI